MNMQSASETFQTSPVYLSRTKARQFFGKDTPLPQAVWQKFSQLFHDYGEARSGWYMSHHALFFDRHLQKYPEEQRCGKIYYIFLVLEGRYGLFTVKYVSASKIDLLTIEELVATEWQETD